MEKDKKGSETLDCNQSQNILRDLMLRDFGFLYYNCYKTNTRNLESVAETNLITKKHNELKYDLPGVPKATFLMAFSPNGTKMASAHGNHNVYISEVATGKNIKILSGHPRTPWCIAFHPSSNQILASGCLGGQVRVWDLRNECTVWNVASKTVIASLTFHPSGKSLVIATHNEIYFLDWRQSEPLAVIRTKHYMEKVRYVAFDNSGRKLITGIGNIAEGPESIHLSGLCRPHRNARVIHRNQIPNHVEPDPLFSEHVPAIMSNFAGITSYRVQAWDFSKEEIPDITNSAKNIVIQRCKIHTDGSIDISSDGKLLAAWAVGAVGIYSLQWETLGQRIYWTETMHAAVSVSISPTQEHLLVGLARSCTHGKYKMASIYKLMNEVTQSTNEEQELYVYFKKGDKSMLFVRDLLQNNQTTTGHISVNCIKWAPQPGQGLVYSTNKGQLTLLH